MKQYLKNCCRLLQNGTIRDNNIRTTDLMAYITYLSVKKMMGELTEGKIGAVTKRLVSVLMEIIKCK